MAAALFLWEGPKVKIVKWVGLLLLLILAGLSGIGYYVFEQLKPAEASSEEIVFTIPEGASSGRIAMILEEEGLVRDGTILSYYFRYKGIGTEFQAGTYAMTPGISVQEMIRKLNAGETVREETLRFTLPEGFTVAQTIGLLAESLGFSREKLEQIAQTPSSFAEHPATGEATRAAGIPERSDYRFKLEGYLFPETYELSKDATEEDAFFRMIAELDRKLATLPEGWEARLAEREITFHELMTIASLVEREVVADTERALVAGVIYNRIEKGMPLQIDATVQYLFDEQKERLFEKDLQIESPYNTYLNAGLPPGPIASPGLESIRAALYPEASEYLFYVTKKDGSGEHLFAKTYEEHLRNIRKSNETAAGT